MLTAQRPVESNADLQERLIRRAWEDERFAELLQVNPREAIALETGIEIPSDVEIHVHSENNETLHLVVPAKPTSPAGDFTEMSGPPTSCPVSCPTVDLNSCPQQPTFDGYDCEQPY